MWMRRSGRGRGSGRQGVIHVVKEVNMCCACGKSSRGVDFEKLILSKSLNLYVVSLGNLLVYPCRYVCVETCVQDCSASLSGMWNPLYIKHGGWGMQLKWSWMTNSYYAAAKAIQ
jgi:hypothetical protein